MLNVFSFAIACLPITEFFEAKAHMQAHSGGTVKFAKAH